MTTKPRIIRPNVLKNDQDSCLKSPVTPEDRSSCAFQLREFTGAGRVSLVPGISPMTQDAEDEIRRVDTEWKFQDEFERNCAIKNSRHDTRSIEPNKSSRSERLFEEMNDALERIELMRKQQQNS